MSSAEFTDWIAYDRISPFGAARDDLRMGIALSAYFNSQSKENETAPRDFMPFLAPDEEGAPEQTVEDQIAVMMRVTEYQQALQDAGAGD